MLRIAITPETECADEARWITTILENGWDYVHLRHPSASRSDIKRIIEAVPQQYHARLRLHGHFELVYEFNLGGLHLNARCPSVPNGYHGSMSRSCHSVVEANTHTECDFVTLSPVFDSVSKQDYPAAFTSDQLRNIAPGRVVALGGITPERVNKLAEYPFAGYAVLGYLWNATNHEDLLRRLKEFEAN